MADSGASWSPGLRSWLASLTLTTALQQNTSQSEPGNEHCKTHSTGASVTPLHSNNISLGRLDHFDAFSTWTVLTGGRKIFCKIDLRWTIVFPSRLNLKLLSFQPINLYCKTWIMNVALSGHNNLNTN